MSGGRARRLVRAWTPRRRELTTHRRGLRSAVVHATAFAWRRATSAPRPLPDYLVIGAQKAATTSLHEYLASHPDVVAPLEKEVHFFSGEVFERGVPWYRAHFPSRRTRSAVERRTHRPTLTGEASTSYLPSRLAPARAAGIVPDVKLVALLRDPVARAISGYQLSVRRGYEKRPMLVAFEDDARTVATHAYDGSSETDLSWSAYLARGHYAEHLERWLVHFARDRVLVVETNTLTRGGGEGYARVLRFLGLPHVAPEVFEEHRRRSYPPASDDVRSWLAEYYAPHNERLWALLGERWAWTGPDASPRGDADGEPLH